MHQVDAGTCCCGRCLRSTTSFLILCAALLNSCTPWLLQMMFEMHYDHPDMALCFGHPNATWADVAALFGELRSSGLRLHYWP